MIAIHDVMTVAEAASALRVSRKTVERMCDAGELHYAKVRRLVRVSAEDVAARLRWVNG